MVQEEMHFKGVSYLELWQPLCSVDRNFLCNFGSRYHKERTWISGSRGNAVYRYFLSGALTALLFSGV